MPTTESSRKTLYLIDGSAYIYRAFFALPALSNSKGLQTNAILGFTTTLLKILRERKPDGLVVAFDEKGPTLRHAEFKAYKAQRPPMPEGMSVQIPYIHRVVDALNIPAVRQAGYEADDLIGTLAHQAEQAGFDVVIVTGDKDMFQLLTPHVRIYDPVKDKWLGEAECLERFGVGEQALHVHLDAAERAELASQRLQRSAVDQQHLVAVRVRGDADGPIPIRRVEVPDPGVGGLQHVPVGIDDSSRGGLRHGPILHGGGGGVKARPAAIIPA